jgi:hypothetical protein
MQCCAVLDGYETSSADFMVHSAGTWTLGIAGCVRIPKNNNCWLHPYFFAVFVCCCFAQAVHSWLATH